jgi:hypothetical protein
MLTGIIYCEDLPSLPQAQDQRAQKALGIMMALTNKYPFPAKTFKTKEGRIGIRGTPEPIMFGDLEEARQWVKAMDKLTRPLGGLLRFEPNCLSTLLFNFSQSDRVITKREHEKEMPPWMSSSPESVEPVVSYVYFINKLKAGRDTMTSASYYVQRADTLRARYPSMTVIFSSLLIVGLAFTCGVILPLLVQSVKSIFIIYIPFLSYVIVYMYVLIRIIRQILNTNFF